MRNIGHKIQRKRPYGRLRHRLKDIKMDWISEPRHEHVDYTEMAWNMIQLWSFANVVMNLHSP
jgi:hypothetical protein